MPLRQSRLKFGNTTVRSEINVSVKSGLLKDNISTYSSAESDFDADTIVVDTTGSIPQLPTPSESVIDPLSLDNQPGLGQLSAKPQLKRVVTGRKSRFREESLDVCAPAAEEKHRTISGETLVNSISQSSLVEKGVEALDLDWTVNNVAMQKPPTTTAEREKIYEGMQQGLNKIRGIIERLNNEPAVDEVLIVHTADDEEDEAERVAKAAARKAKMEDNAKKWEARKKVAEKNATRKSNRASFVFKASEKLSNIASTVLGKRTRDQTSTHEGPRIPRENSKQESSKLAEPANKRVCLATDTQSQQSTQPMSAPKPTSTRREKKWLVKGLYAGQERTFDARLTESSNKKKSSTKEDELPRQDNSLLPLPMFAGERLLKQGRDFKLPFDVYCPPPPGQPKPVNWKKQNKNVLVDDACDLWRYLKNDESSTCLCRSETGCDHNCLNRMMYYECDSSNCNLASQKCGNRQWENLQSRVKMNTPYSIGVDVVKTADRGHGVRASRTFEPNELILEYTGEIITQEECEHRMRSEYKDNECYYLMLFDQNMILDATKGSMARFVNHSCEPNCRMEKWTVHEFPRMALFAGENGIMTGEELTYDYNFDPYSQKNTQQCRCGSAKCRGFLGPKPKDAKQKSPERDDAGKKPEGRLAGAKRKIAEALDEKSNILSKKKKPNPPKVTAKTSKAKPAKAQTSNKVIVVKKVTTKKVRVIKSSDRKDSKLEKIISHAKNKTLTKKSKRVISSSSMKESLIKKDSAQTKTSSKSKSKASQSSKIKEKASALKRNVVKSVRGRNK